jgi:hypothetical protein
VSGEKGGYCGVRGPGGFYCILGRHEGHEHLSIDNTKLWKGTPGEPIFWRMELVTPDPEPTTLPVRRAETAVDKARLQGFTGEFCAQCNSPNTKRIGSCLQCADCHHSGSCG